MLLSQNAVKAEFFNLFNDVPDFSSNTAGICVLFEVCFKTSLKNFLNSSKNDYCSNIQNSACASHNQQMLPSPNRF